MAQQVQWGTTTLILDDEVFRRGFLAARRWYFEDIYGKDSRHPEELRRALPGGASTIRISLWQRDRIA